MQPLSSELRPLGKSGIMVSPIAWGMWRYRGDDVNAARHLVETALEAGITLFDTADVYGPDNGEPFGAAESLLGRVLAEAPHLRERMVLATKGGIIPGVPYDSSAAYIIAAVDASLGRLGLDHLDLWQIHRPDLLAHPSDVACSLEALVASGKVRAIGVSNHSASQVSALLSHLNIPLASIQPEFSPVTTAPIWDGVLDQAMALDLAVLAWSPLGGGRLVSGNNAAYSWIMSHPARPIPIIGSQSLPRIARQGMLQGSMTRGEGYTVLEASIGEKLP